MQCELFLGLILALEAGGLKQEDILKQGLASN